MKDYDSVNKDNKTCCFIGHRKIYKSNILIEKLKQFIENLIIEKNVTIFIFGSKSEFNDLAYEIVKSLKLKYSKIKMIVYTCKNETNICNSQLLLQNNLLNKISHKNFKLQSFDEEIDFRTKYNCRKNSYIERNKSMIDASDYCIFYYDEIISVKNFEVTHKNSGTKISFYYAKKQYKTIINILQESNIKQ